MIKNVGGIDKVLRITLGLSVIIAGIVMQSWWGVIGLLPLFTATTGWCPAYLPFNFSSAKKSE